MNRYDFMRQLEMLLSDITPNERKEALQFYNDYFDDAGAENEQNVIKALGSPAKVAASIKADLTGNGATGEFTETGYKDSFSKNQEIMKYGQPNPKAEKQNDPYQNNPYSNRASGKNPYSSQDTVYSDNQSGFHQENSYNNNRYNNSSYNNSDYNNDRYNNSNNNNNNNSYNNSYDNNSYNGAGGYSGTAKKKEMSGGTLALVILLCIIGIPILLPLGLGLLGAAIGIVVGILSLFIALAAVAFALVIVGVVLLVVGISKLIIAPFGGLYLAGGGLACIGMGILFAILTIWLCVTVVPAIVRGIAGLSGKLFTKRNASKV